MFLLAEILQLVHYLGAQYSFRISGGIFPVAAVDQRNRYRPLRCELQLDVATLPGSVLMRVLPHSRRTTSFVSGTQSKTRCCASAAGTVAPANSSANVKAFFICSAQCRQISRSSTKQFAPSRITAVIAGYRKSYRWRRQTVICDFTHLA